MHKHLPKTALKWLKKIFYTVRELVIIPGNEDRRNHNNNNEAIRTDANIEDREDKFADQIDSKYV